MLIREARHFRNLIGGSFDPRRRRYCLGQDMETGKNSFEDVFGQAKEPSPQVEISKKQSSKPVEAFDDEFVSIPRKQFTLSLAYALPAKHGTQMGAAEIGRNCLRADSQVHSALFG